MSSFFLFEAPACDFVPSSYIAILVIQTLLKTCINLLIKCQMAIAQTMLRRVHLLNCLLLELIRSNSMFYNLGNHLVITVKPECHVHLPFGQHARSIGQSLILPACDLRTLGLTYVTPQSLLHSVLFTDITLSRDEIFQVNPSVLPFQVLLQYTQVMIGTYTITSVFLPSLQIRVELLTEDPLLQKFIITFGSSDLFIELLNCLYLLGVGSLSLASGHGRTTASFLY